MNLLGFGLLFAANQNNINIVYIGVGIMALYTIMYSVIVACKMGDKFIVPMACMLITMGIILLCRIRIDFGLRQIVWVAIGICVFFIAYAIYYNVRVWDKMWLLYFIGERFFFLQL